jgi:FkbM family methyltransferase
MSKLSKNILNKVLRLSYRALGDREAEWLARRPTVHRMYHRLEMYANDKRALSFLCTVNEHKMFVYSGEYRKFSSGQTYEKDTTQVFRELLNNGDVVIDIGAHYGYYTLLAASLVGENGLVFAFEPCDQSYDLLVKNIKLNGYPNVEAIKRAVSSVSGMSNFFLRSNASAHSLFDDTSYMSPTQETIVEITSLDDFFQLRYELIPRITVIKIDAEGAEMLIISGMDNIFKNNTNLSLILEFIPNFIRASGYAPEDVLSRITELGFAIEIIGLKAMYSLPEIIDYTEKHSSVNLLCTRMINERSKF